MRGRRNTVAAAPTPHGTHIGDCLEHEAHVGGFFPIDNVAGEHHACCSLRTNDLWHEVCSTHPLVYNRWQSAIQVSIQAHPDQGRKSCQHTHRVKAELDERNTELGRLGSDADIATHSHAESSANRWAVDGSDYRDRELPQTQEVLQGR